jgi:hypothetical protein
MLGELHRALSPLLDAVPAGDKAEKNWRISRNE